MSNYSIFRIFSNTINDINYCNSIFQTLQFIISIISTMANISNIIISYTLIISHILNTRNISNRRVVESVSARWRKALVAHVKKKHGDGNWWPGDGKKWSQWEVEVTWFWQEWELNQHTSFAKGKRRSGPAVTAVSPGVITDEAQEAQDANCDTAPCGVMFCPRTKGS